MRIYLLIAAIAGGVTWLVTPLIRHVAIEIGAVGEVRARDVHTIPTPRMGGLGMLIGFAVATVFASRLPFLSGLFNGNYQMWVILAGGIMISLLGMADDLWDLDWMLKLAGQLLISVFVAWGGLQIISLPLGGSLITASPSLSMAITAFLIVASINAVNFVDGPRWPGGRYRGDWWHSVRRLFVYHRPVFPELCFVGHADRRDDGGYLRGLPAA